MPISGGSTVHSGEGKAAETRHAKAGSLSDPGMMGSLAEEETG